MHVCSFMQAAAFSSRRAIAEADDVQISLRIPANKALGPALGTSKQSLGLVLDIHDSQAGTVWQGVLTSIRRLPIEAPPGADVRHSGVAFGAVWVLDAVRLKSCNAARQPMATHMRRSRVWLSRYMFGEEVAGTAKERIGAGQWRDARAGSLGMHMSTRTFHTGSAVSMRPFAA